MLCAYRCVASSLSFSVFSTYDGLCVPRAQYAKHLASGQSRKRGGFKSYAARKGGPVRRQPWEAPKAEVRRPSVHVRDSWRLVEQWPAATLAKLAGIVVHLVFFCILLFVLLCILLFILLYILFFIFCIFYMTFRWRVRLINVVFLVLFLVGCLGNAPRKVKDLEARGTVRKFDARFERVTAERPAPLETE